MEPIILASSSPRRQDILKMLNIPFQVIIPEVDESVYQSEDLFKIPEELAVRKVEKVIEMSPPQQKIHWILGADTLIIFNNKIYGKPEDQKQAFDFIKAFQGKTHSVVTAIALYNGETQKIETENTITKVSFKEMSDKEINWYIESGEWHGVAGAYRIQGLASCFIKEIEGTMSAVAGLPISSLYDILSKQNYSILE